MAVSGPEELKRNVGRRVAECRRARGLTQLALAERLDVSLQYVQRVEGGRINLTLESLDKWAVAVGTDVRSLLEPASTHAQRGRPRSALPGLPLPRSTRSAKSLPVYRFRPAAGAWSEWQPGGVSSWVRPPPGVRPRKGLFVVQVEGASMEPDIPDHAWCLCSMPWPAPRAGEVGIFVRTGSGDPEGGGHFTLKEYAPRRLSDRVEGALKARNPLYAPIAPRGDESERPFARFIRVVGTG